MLQNHNFIFLIILFSVTLAAATLFATDNSYAQTNPTNQTIAITTTIDPITILTNELMPLLDTSAIGNLTSLTVTTNLPCDTSNVPKLKIIAGILGNTTNVIDSSSDYTNNKGPRDTCVFTDKITNVTAKGIPAMNRVFLKNAGSTPVHIPEGVMVTLTGIFGNPAVVKLTGQPDFQDDYTSSGGWTSFGSGVSITGGAVYGDTSDQNGSGVRRALGFTISDTLWTANFDYRRPSGSDQANVGFALTAGTGNPYSASQDMIGIYGNDASIYIVYKDGAGSLTTENPISISLNTWYYITEQRTDSTHVKLYVYSDQARTSQVAGSPVTGLVPSTVTSLTTIQHATSDPLGGHTGHFLDLDNTKIWNGVTLPP